MYQDTAWLNTKQIAHLFNVTRITAGSWFRKGHIPAEEQRRVPVQHENGLTITEWQARAEFMKSFRPPAKGPRRKT